MNDTNKCIQVGCLSGGKWDKNFDCIKRYYSVFGIRPTITTCGGGNREPKIAEYIKCEVNNMIESTQETHAEWKQEMFKQFVEDAEGEISGVNTNQSKTFGYRPPIKGASKCLRANANDVRIVERYRIRKLTPKECWRLMGISDNNFEKVRSIGISDSSLYKQAGNGIVTNCVKLIFEHLYKAQYDNTYVCTDEVIDYINKK